MIKTILKKFNWEETKSELPFSKAIFNLIDLEGGGVIPELVYIQDDDGPNYEIGFFHLSNEGFEKNILGTFQNKILAFSGIRLSELVQEELLTIDEHNNITLYEYDNVGKKLELLERINSNAVSFAIKLKTYYFNQETYALIIGDKASIFKIVKDSVSNYQIKLLYDSSKVIGTDIPSNLEDGYLITLVDENNFEILLCSDESVCILEVKNGKSNLKCDLVSTNSFIIETYCYIPDASKKTAHLISKTLHGVFYFKYDGQTLTKEELEINQDFLDSITHHESTNKEPTPLVIGDFENIGKISLLKNLLTDEDVELISLEEIQVDDSFKLKPIDILSHQYNKLGITFIIVIFQQETDDFLSDEVSSIMIYPFYVQTNYEIIDDDTLSIYIVSANKTMNDIDLFFTHALDCFYFYEDEFEAEQINLEVIMDSIDIIDLIIPRTDMRENTKKNLEKLRVKYDAFTKSIERKHHIDLQKKKAIQLEKVNLDQIFLKIIKEKIINSKDFGKNLVVNYPLRLSFDLHNPSTSNIYDIRFDFDKIESILKENTIDIYLGCKEENLIDILKPKSTIRYNLWLETSAAINLDIKLPLIYSIIVDEKKIDKKSELIIPDFECSTLLQLATPVIVNQSRGPLVVQDSCLEKDLIYHYQINIKPVRKITIIECTLKLDQNIVPNEPGFKTLLNREISPGKQEITDYLSFTPKKIGKSKIGPLIIKTTDGVFVEKEIEVEIKDKIPIFHINNIELVKNEAVKGDKPQLGIPFLVSVTIGKNDVEIKGIKPYIKPLTNNLKVLDDLKQCNLSNRTVIEQNFKLVPISEKFGEKASIQVSFIHGKQSDTKIIEFELDLSEPKIISMCSIQEPYPTIRDVNDKINIEVHIKVEAGYLKNPIFYFNSPDINDLIIYPKDTSLDRLDFLEKPTFDRRFTISTNKKITKATEVEFIVSYHSYYNDEIENRSDNERINKHLKTIPIFIDTKTRKIEHISLELVRKKLIIFLKSKQVEYKKCLKNNQPFLPFAFSNSNLPNSVKEFSLMTIIPLLQELKKIVISDSTGNNYFITEHINHMFETMVNAGINIFETQYNFMKNISNEILTRYYWNFIRNNIQKSDELFDSI
ncbi:MAG: hypothetical protein HGN29_14980 [Asgard group archaeon]|nr:hypothetical protein [Asgard group archaeon]